MTDGETKARERERDPGQGLGAGCRLEAGIGEVACVGRSQQACRPGGGSQGSSVRAARCPPHVGRQRAGVLALARAGVRAQGLTLLCWCQQRRAKCHLSLFSAAKLSEQIPGVIPAACLSYLTPPGIPIILKGKMLSII